MAQKIEERKLMVFEGGDGNQGGFGERNLRKQADVVVATNA